MVLSKISRLTGLLLVIGSMAFAQKQVMVNDEVIDFPVPKILNYARSSSSFGELNRHLLVIDFFGTWCVPCLRALPNLSELQLQFKDEITIILVSEEKQQKLESFLSKQADFRLPVVVDENRNFAKIFQPPAYPYTVIVGKQGNILAIPAHEAMTKANINQWLKMQDSETMETKIADDNRGTDSTSTKAEMKPVSSANKLVQLSQDFMYAAKTGEDVSAFLTGLQQLSFDTLLTEIKSDNEKKAFWINLYNAFTHFSLKKEPGMYHQRGKFFGGRRYMVAGRALSLDDIEHGILRKSKVKWSLGYLNKLFPGSREKMLRVMRLDYRIHFALNCGAKSCPPIAFYTPDNIDRQLDLATSAYLSGEVEYDSLADVVRLPKLMSWFRRDFGGKKQMIELLKKLSLVPVDKDPKIKFKPYDWTLYLQNYKS